MNKKKISNVSQLIVEGKKNIYYKRLEWEELRQLALERDHHECQMCNGNWTDGIHEPLKIQLKMAKPVHHIKPLELYPELAKDLNNLVSLCNTCHNIVEDRYKAYEIKTKEILNDERWD